MTLSWLFMAALTFAASPEAETKSKKEIKTVKVLQSTVAQIGGCSVGLIKVRSRESSVTGKAYYLADINVTDRATRKEQSYMVGEGNDMEIGTQRVKISEVRPAPTEEDRGYVIFELLADD